MLGALSPLAPETPLCTALSVLGAMQTPTLPYPQPARTCPNGHAGAAEHSLQSPQASKYCAGPHGLQLDPPPQKQQAAAESSCPQ